MPQITMPKLNDFGDSGEVSEILISVGDQVAAGDVVMNVEMEKSVVEIESTHDGTVKSIKVAEGDEVDVDQVLIELE